MAVLLACILVACLLASCGAHTVHDAQAPRSAGSAETTGEDSLGAQESGFSVQRVVPDGDIVELEDGLSAIAFEGDDGLSDFLGQGGAENDSQVVEFLTSGALKGSGAPLSGKFGCSALSVRSPEGSYLFGRNFDWYGCDALVVSARPAGAHASVSTVNFDFLRQAAPALASLPSSMQALAAMYAPLDGMNDAGLCVAVLMIEDGAERIDQDSGKSDLTTTTAVRAMLDRAATVEEALELLGEYDMHSSMGLMVHFALSDATGRAVAVEYVDGEMVVTKTDVLTNFYVAAGSKHGVGTAQSHERYEVLEEALSDNPTMSEEGVRDVLESVCKRHYSDGETTEWSMVCDKSAGRVVYCHREDYSHGYVFETGKAGA